MEEVLKEAARTQSPATIRDVWENPAVKEVAKNEIQIRDKLRTLHENNLIVKVTVPSSQTGDKKYRVGFYWRDMDKTSMDLASLRPRTPAPAYIPPAQEVDATQPVKHPVKVSREIELVVDGLTVIVGKNQQTGRLRIVIE
jgi:hypothetical protein